MNIDKIIEYLKENNLLELLSKRMYYINYVNYRHILGKSVHVDWLERVELHYQTKYYINGKDFFVEDMVALYDEWDYIGTSAVSPVECFKQKPLSYDTLIELIKKLPEEKMHFLLKTLDMDDLEIRRLLHDKEIERQSNIATLKKSINDMQTSLCSMISIMGSKITMEDVENIKNILDKANIHVEELNHQEINPTLRLK